MQIVQIEIHFADSSVGSHSLTAYKHYKHYNLYYIFQERVSLGLSQAIHNFENNRDDYKQINTILDFFKTFEQKAAVHCAVDRIGYHHHFMVTQVSTERKSRTEVSGAHTMSGSIKLNSTK